MRPTRVLYVENDPTLRGIVGGMLRQQPGLDIVASCADANEALATVDPGVLDVALLDLRMPGLDGAQVAAALARQELPTRVLVLSAYTEPELVYQALQLGVAGYLPKESSRSQIVSAVLDCAAGRDVLAPELASGLAAEIRRRAEPSGPSLSPREREVLHLIAGGESIPAIAKELFLAPSTIKTHVHRLYEKLGVTDRAAAVAEAMRRGLLE